MEIKNQEQEDHRAEPQNLLNQPPSIGLVRSLEGDSTTCPLELVARDTPGSYTKDLTGPRAQPSNTFQHQYKLEDRNITIARGPPNTITVNVVSIINLQKSRKTGTHKEQGTKKNNKKKDPKKPVIATPSNEKITKYFVRKHQDEDDIKQQSTRYIKNKTIVIYYHQEDRNRNFVK